MFHFDSPQFSAKYLAQLAQDIKQWASELGFAQTGITDTDLQQEEPLLKTWLDNQFHGDMSYMETHGLMRARPQELHPGTQRVISVRMDYLPPNAGFATNLSEPELGYISRYAGGRDYHKLMRNKLKKLGDKINAALSEQNFSITCEYRPFVDSAPILERPLAQKAGIGWTGKHSLILNQAAGSWFFIGELLINLPLPIDKPIANECNNCVACITNCPTNAIVAPYIVDSRRCISYLTIEHQGIIDEALRPLIGNRIYGCDDCQLICPTNKAAPLTQETDFHTRPQLQRPHLLTLFAWTEETFLTQTQGSAIRRLGHQRWLRNIAIALGNAPQNPQIIAALTERLNAPNSVVSDMVKIHIKWALKQQQADKTTENRQQARLIRTIQKGLPRDA